MDAPALRFTKIVAMRIEVSSNLFLRDVGRQGEPSGGLGEERVAQHLSNRLLCFRQLMLVTCGLGGWRPPSTYRFVSKWGGW